MGFRVEGFRFRVQDALWMQGLRSVQRMDRDQLLDSSSDNTLEFSNGCHAWAQKQCISPDDGPKRTLVDNGQKRTCAVPHVHEIVDDGVSSSSVKLGSRYNRLRARNLVHKQGQVKYIDG